jgi:hypothetical protein
MTPDTLATLKRKVQKTHIPILERTFLHSFPRFDLLDEPYLIASILEGDQEAFAVLVQPYLHLFTIGIHRIVQDLEDTQEALEEALLNMHSELNLITDRNAFFTWAYRICLHEGLLLRHARSGSVAEFRGRALSSF